MVWWSSILTSTDVALLKESTVNRGLALTFLPLTMLAKKWYRYNRTAYKLDNPQSVLQDCIKVDHEKNCNKRASINIKRPQANNLPHFLLLHTYRDTVSFMDEFALFSPCGKALDALERENSSY